MATLSSVPIPPHSSPRPLAAASSYQAEEQITSKPGLSLRPETQVALELSQDDLADRLLSTRTEVYRYEKGKHEMGICTLIQYAEALKTTPQSVMPARFVPHPVNERLSSVMRILSSLSDESLGAIEAMATTLQKMEQRDAPLFVPFFSDMRTG